MHPTPPILIHAKSKRGPGLKATRLRSARRTQEMIDHLLAKMQCGLMDGSYRKSVEWKELFGEANHFVANLHKLVHSMKALPELPESKPQASRAKREPLSNEEMKLLQAWLNDKELPNEE